MAKPLGLADRAGFVVLGNTAQSLAQLATIVVLTRLFSRGDYGSYRQVWLVYFMLSPVLLLGVPSSVLYFLPRLESDERRRFALRTVCLLLVLGALLSVLIAGAAPLIAARMHNPHLLALLRTFSLYALFALPAAVLPNLLVAGGRHRAAGAITGGFALMLAAGVITAAATTQQVIWALRAAVGVAVLEGGVVIAVVLRTQGFAFNLDWPALRRQLAWSVPVGLSGTMTLLAKRISNAIVGLTHLPAEYAIYDVGAFEVPLVGVLTFSITTTLLPVFSGMHHRDEIGSLIRLWHESMRKVALILFPLFALLFVLAPDLVVLVFSSKYAASTPIFRIYLLLLPLRTTVYSSVLVAAGETGLLMAGAVGFLFLAAGLTWALLGPFGMQGAAAATVIATYILAVFYLAAVKRKLAVETKDIFPWRRVPGILAVACVVGAAVWPLSLPHWALWPRMALLTVAYFALYLSISRALGLLSTADLRLAYRWITLQALRQR